MPQTTKGKGVQKTPSKATVSWDVFSYSKKALEEYGKEVLFNRAVPSLQDGCKPVHRLIGWAAHHDLHLKDTGQYIKSARVAGETMGKYHPHGDSAIYESMITMSRAKSKMPILAATGNWGTDLDRPAGQRYTECRLTSYAVEHVLHPDYLAVVPYEPNYDGTLKSPMWLPARLPHVLFSNAIGIAVGARTEVPPFAPKGIVQICKMFAEGATVTNATLLKHLRFDYYSGCQLISEPKEVMELYKNGKGTLYFGSLTEIKGSEIGVFGLPPQFNWSQKNPEKKTVSKTLNDSGLFSSFYTDSDELGLPCIRLTLKRGAKLADAEELIRQCFSCSVSFEMNVNIRTEKGSIEFGNYPMLDLFKHWYEYRKDLEIKTLKYQISVIQRSTRRNELLMLAIKHADTLVKLIKQKHANRAAIYAAIAKLLKVSLEDAQYVHDLTLGRLSSLDKAETEAKIAALLLNEKNLRAKLAKPDQTLAGYFTSTKF